MIDVFYNVGESRYESTHGRQFHIFGHIIITGVKLGANLGGAFQLCVLETEYFDDIHHFGWELIWESFLTIDFSYALRHSTNRGY